MTQEEQVKKIAELNRNAMDDIFDIINKDWTPDMESLEIVVNDPDEIEYQKDNIYSEMNKGSRLKQEIKEVMSEVKNEIFKLLTQGGN